MRGNKSKSDILECQNSSLPRNFKASNTCAAFSSHEAGEACINSVCPAASVTEGEILRHKTLKYGAPGLDKLRFFEDFAISFDTRTKCPEWVLERISRTDKARTGDR